VLYTRTIRDIEIGYLELDYSHCPFSLLRSNNWKSLEDWLCNILSIIINHLEDFIGVTQSSNFLLISLLLLLVPIPLINLTGFKASFLGKILHESSCPIIILAVFILEYFNLLLILPPPSFLLGASTFIIIIWGSIFILFFHFTILLDLWFSNSLWYKWLVNEV